MIKVKPTYKLTVQFIGQPEPKIYLTQEDISSLIRDEGTFSFKETFEGTKTTLVLRNILWFSVIEVTSNDNT